MKKKIKEKAKVIISKTKSAYYLTKESIKTLGEDSPYERNIYDLQDLYERGEAIGEEDTLIQALTECFNIEENGGRIASSPEITLMRNMGLDHLVWETSYDTFSSEHVGVDTNGIFTEPGNHVIVFAHNTGIPSIHTILSDKPDSSLLEKGVRYDQYFFDQLLTGTTQDGLGIELYPLDEYTEGYKPTPYGLVMPISSHEIERRKKKIFAKGINEKNPHKSYYLSPIAKGRSGLDIESLREYVEKCLLSTANKKFFFDYFDYDLPNKGEAEVRIINVTRSGFQINNQNNPHNFYGIHGEQID